MYKTVLLSGIILLGGFSFACSSNMTAPQTKVVSSHDDVLSKTIATLVSLKTPELYNKYVDLNTFEVLDYNTLLERLKNIQVIYVAEQHTNEAHHKLQEDILMSLFQKNPKTVLAMEFLYRSKQQVIDDYISGNMSEEAFDKTVKDGFGDWYRYYVGLIRYARQNNLKTVAMNVEREIKRKMAKFGWDKLAPQEQKLIAKDIDTSNKAHRDFVMKQFDGMMNNPQTKDMLKGPMMDQMYLLQCMWDETFAEAIANYLKSINDTGAQVVVVAGAGHISYKFTIPERSYKRFLASYRTLIPVGIDGDSDITNKSDFFGQVLLSGIGDYVYFSPQSVGE
ncbi:MAG: ChaN family lipoprotein [Planctomycetota bacterium]